MELTLMASHSSSEIGLARRWVGSSENGIPSPRRGFPALDAAEVTSAVP